MDNTYESFVGKKYLTVIPRTIREAAELSHGDSLIWYREADRGILIAMKKPESYTDRLWELKPGAKHPRDLSGAERPAFEVLIPELSKYKKIAFQSELMDFFFHNPDPKSRALLHYLFTYVEGGAAQGVTSYHSLSNILIQLRGDLAAEQTGRLLFQSFPNLTFYPYDQNVAELTTKLLGKYSNLTIDQGMDVATAIAYRADVLITKDYCNLEEISTISMQKLFDLIEEL